MTSPAADPQLLVLHRLRLSGFVAADVVALRTGLDPEATAAALQRASDAGFAKERTGRISGWVLLPPGRVAHAQLLADELAASGARAAVEAADVAFLELNEPFKAICTRWQLRADGTPNDHADDAYDAAVISELAALHPRATAVTDRLAAVLPRFGQYRPDLTAALERLQSGDKKAFAAPLSASYHDVWMELHQDLLSTLGRERAAADGH